MPKPVLQAMVLAEHVYRDTSGKHIIAGTFTAYLIQNAATAEPSEPAKPDTLQEVRGLVERAGTPYLYIAMFGVRGEVPLELKYVDLADASVLFKAEMTVTASDPVAVAEYILPMPRQIIRNKVGSYSLDLLYDNELLGQWRVAVRKMDASSEGN